MQINDNTIELRNQCVVCLASLRGSLHLLIAILGFGLIVPRYNYSVKQLRATCVHAHGIAELARRTHP